jgi:hypothetical protein
MAGVEGIVAMEDISEGIRIGRVKVMEIGVVEISEDSDRRILIMATRAEMRGSPTLFPGADGTLKRTIGARPMTEEDQSRDRARDPDPGPDQGPTDQQLLLEGEPRPAQHLRDDDGTGTTLRRHRHLAESHDANDHGRIQGRRRLPELDVLLRENGDPRRIPGRGGGRMTSVLRGEKGSSISLIRWYK